MREYIVENKDFGQRFDKYVARLIPNAPTSFLYKMFRKKNITLNGKKAIGNERLSQGDIVRLFLADDTIDSFVNAAKDSVRKGKDDCNNAMIKSYNFPNGILYEDDNILLYNKPEGLLSQKADRDDISVNELLLDYLNESGQINPDSLKMYTPSVVNRLDRNTSGIIICAKNYASANELSYAIKEKTLKKYYICVVSGDFPKDAEYKDYLIKNSSSNIVRISDKHTEGSTLIHTLYNRIDGGQGISLVEAMLYTGKSHQIRSQLSYHGFPLIGDYKYGIKTINDKYNKMYGIKSQMLFSYRVVMPHFDGILTYLSDRDFSLPLPTEFKEIMNFGDMEQQRT